VPFSALISLFEVEGVEIFILQPNPKAAGWKEGLGIYPGEFILFDYARVIKGLDLLITVDSMPAHLAGALNVPVWVMLQRQADWRWMEDRNDSPWYPSMKLFRQEKQREWERVVRKVRERLKVYLGV
jgi:ADP-heptose:LPS heptosyltransferase